MPMHPAVPRRLDEATNFLQLSGRIQQRALDTGVDASNAAHARRVLAEAAWEIIAGDAAASALSEARQLAEAAQAVPGVASKAQRLLVAACQLLSGMVSSDALLAKHAFDAVARPFGEAAGALADDPFADETVPLQTWKQFAHGVASAVDANNPHPLILETLAGLLRLRLLPPARLPDAALALRISYNGPYLYTGNAPLTDHLGQSVTGDRPVALCRCGRSLSKPFCDGSHVAAEFTGVKDPRRVPDHRDSYQGQVTVIFDNRGLCAHSGFCTDRLNGVFHLGEEPFVTPSGARFDEIIRAVRKCPSGALSYGLDQQEVREHVDQPRPPNVEVSRNGPYRITGAIPLLEERGASAARPQGASVEHYSLCRCGSSLNKPFCSGMHWLTNFIDPVPDPAAQPTLFEWAGGYPALLDMTTIFYSKYVPQDPLIGPLFASMSPDHPERVAAWLSEVFGGPKLYSERYGGYARMISHHVGKNITPEQRQRWASLMVQSADDAGLPADAEFRAAFLAYIEWGSRIAVENSAPSAKPPPNMPVPRWWWVCGATPGSRLSALAPEQHEGSAWSPPKAGEPLDFHTHIKPLFRPLDRNSMKMAFDLWLEADVLKHGEAILARLKSGTMPCDGAWPPEKISVLEMWLSRGPGT
jgi:CDGSH-type Zn-finger protein/truncated hemoglobin YjbI